MMTSDRDSVISRIQKLQKMTTERGCSESEAVIAARKVAELIAEHNVNDTELRLRTDAKGCLHDELLIFGVQTTGWLSVTAAISRLFSVQSWYSKEFEDPFGIGLVERRLSVHYYGYPEDVAAAVAMTSICRVAIETELIRWKKNSKGNNESFRIGMASRLYERILDMIPTTQPSNSRSLIPLKNQLVNEEFAKYCRENRLRLGTEGGRHIRDHSAYSAGRRRAENVSLRGRKEVGSSQRRIT
jgi:hypothetical protein